MAVRPRKLVFFIIDDDDNKGLQLPANCQIEIWHPPGSTVAANAPSVSGWYEHSVQAHHYKEISYDGLSIDVNFHRDASDPMWLLNENPPSDICAGLYHGLTAMARRRGHDEYGNALPLAWELRTVAPEMEWTSDQQVEIARIYGLLLALANPVIPGDAFVGLEDDGTSSYPELVLKSFRAQKPRSGAAIDSIKNLLPKWRDRMTEAVRANRVRVDLDRLQKLRTALTKDLNRRGEGSILDSKHAVITLLDRDKVACEAIELASIFNDEKVVSLEDFNATVQPWLNDLIGEPAMPLGGFVGAAVEWIIAAGYYLEKKKGEFPENAPQLSQQYADLAVQLRMLILVGYQVASRLDGKRFPPALQHDLANALGFDHHDQIFLRPLKNLLPITSVGTLTALDKQVLQRMAETTLDLRFSPELCQALANILYECGLEDKGREGFPALAGYFDLIYSVAAWSWASRAASARRASRRSRRALIALAMV